MDWRRAREDKPFYLSFVLKSLKILQLWLKKQVWFAFWLLLNTEVGKPCAVLNYIQKTTGLGMYIKMMYGLHEVHLHYLFLICPNIEEDRVEVNILWQQLPLHCCQTSDNTSFSDTEVVALFSST